MQELTSNQVAKLLGVTRQRVHQLDGVLRPRLVPTSGLRGKSGRCWRRHYYDESIVRAYLESRR